MKLKNNTTEYNAENELLESYRKSLNWKIEWLIRTAKTNKRLSDLSPIVGGKE